MLGLECSITCSRDVGVDSERRLAAFEEELEKINWLDKVTNEEVRRGKQANTELRPEHSQKKISGQKFSQISGQISGHMTSRRPKPCTDKG